MASPVNVGTVTVPTVPTLLTVTRFPPIHVSRGLVPVTITALGTTAPSLTGRLWPRTS